MVSVVVSIRMRKMFAEVRKTFSSAQRAEQDVRERQANWNSTSRLYVLESINGQHVPAIQSAGAGDTLWVVWSTITLGADGKADIVDHVKHAHLNYGAEENTYLRNQPYRISGDSLTIGSYQGCPDICASPVVGLLADSTLTISPPSAAVQLYRLTQTY